MLINCDIGDKESIPSVDDELISFIDIANIACGGHAGDTNSIKHYQELAQQHGITTTALLSYPDRENFGQRVMSISNDGLITALEKQLEAFGSAERIKFHGALYAQSNRSAELAGLLAQWFHKIGTKEVITPYRSMLDKTCSEQGIPVMHEAFADRSYANMTLGLELMPRDQIGAMIDNVDDIVRQVRKMKNSVIEVNGENYLIEADTVNVDTHNPLALQAVKALSIITSK
jgi:UPF0271 protein